MSQRRRGPGPPGVSFDVGSRERRAAESDAQACDRGVDREKLLEHAQREATELEAIFAAHTDTLVIYGPDGGIRRVNPAARELLGVVQGESSGAYRDRLMAMEPVDGRGEPLVADALPSRRALRGETVTGVVVGLHTPNGLVWTSVSAAPLWAPDGSIAGAVVSSVNITRLRRLQEEREQVQRALTHDARTRLNVIRLHGEVLGRPALADEGARRRAGIIVSNISRLTEIIDALVDGR